MENHTHKKCPLEVTICLYVETLWRRDIDGAIKAVMDACFSYLELNDNLAVDLRVSKRADANNPRCEIAIRTIPKETFDALQSTSICPDAS